MDPHGWLNGCGLPPLARYRRLRSAAQSGESNLKSMRRSPRQNHVAPGTVACGPCGRKPGRKM